jgi:hypothetical protein
MPVTHPINARIQEILPEVLQESNGERGVSAFPNNLSPYLTGAQRPLPVSIRNGRFSATGAHSRFSAFPRPGKDPDGAIGHPHVL